MSTNGVLQLLLMVLLQKLEVRYFDQLPDSSQRFGGMVTCSSPYFP